jgi:hypothetical protein
MGTRTSVKMRLRQYHQPSLHPRWLETRLLTPTTVRFFFLLLPKCNPSFGGGYIKKKLFYLFLLRSDPIHERRAGGRGDEKPALEIDVSASALSSSAR